jgi:hypothetical protein
MLTTSEQLDERFPVVLLALYERGLDLKSAAIAANYVIECLDVQESRFDKEREPFG